MQGKKGKARAVRKCLYGEIPSRVNGERVNLSRCSQAGHEDTFPCSISNYEIQISGGYGQMDRWDMPVECSTPTAVLCVNIEVNSSCKCAFGDVSYYIFTL